LSGTFIVIGGMMKRGFLIDLENVQSAGLDGVDQLTDEDTVIVFYSNKADNLKIDMVKTIQESSANVVYLKVFNGTPNALDFQLLTYLYYYYNPEDEDAQYWIISRDTGYDASITMSRKLGANNIRRAPAIKNAVHYKLKSDKIASIRRERKLAELREETAENMDESDDTAAGEVLENDEVFDGSAPHAMEEGSDESAVNEAEGAEAEHAAAEADHAKESEELREFEDTEEDAGMATKDAPESDEIFDGALENEIAEDPDHTAEGEELRDGENPGAVAEREALETEAETDASQDSDAGAPIEPEEAADAEVPIEPNEAADTEAAAADETSGDEVSEDEVPADADSHEHERSGRRRRPRRRSRRKTPRAAETEEAETGQERPEEPEQTGESVQGTEPVQITESAQATEPAQAEEHEAAYTEPVQKRGKNRPDAGKDRTGTGSAARREIPADLRAFLAQNVEVPFDDRTLSVIVLGLEQCERRGEFYQFFRRHLGGKHGAEVYRNVKNHLGEMRELLQ